MKAVIVEIQGKKAAVLSDDGCITTIRNRDYEIGQVIVMERKSVQMPRLLTAAAAAAVVLLGSAAGAYAWMTPYSYVSMDVNPSVEYTLNRFDRVLSVRAVNDDASEVLAEASIRLDDLKGKTVEEALSVTIEALDGAERKYFENEEGNVVIATWCKDVAKAEKLAQKLEQSASRDLEDKENVEVEASAVGQERVEQARELQQAGIDITPGRLNLLEKLEEARGGDGQLSQQEVTQLLEENLSVKEIMKEVKEAKENGKDSAPGQQNKEEAPGQQGSSGNQGDKEDPGASGGKESAPGQQNKEEDPGQQGSSGNQGDKNSQSASGGKDSAPGQQKKEEAPGQQGSSGNQGNKNSQSASGGKDSAPGQQKKP